MTASDVTKKPKRISRRKKARAKKTLQKALNTVIREVERDTFLRSHLFISKMDDDKLAVGSYIITKTSKGLYNVYKKTLRDLVFENLYTFDAAMGLVEAMNAGSTRGLDDIVKADDVFGHNHGEMLRFETAFRREVEQNTGNADLYEARYLVVSDRAQKALTELKRFRIVKQ